MAAARSLTPERLLFVMATTGAALGAVVGLILGTRYLPTLPFAVVEGALFGLVPATLLGLLVAGSWSLARRARRR